MYTRILIPLDGSKTAEKVLPYARFLSGQLKLPVELLAVVDIVEMATHIFADGARYLDTMIEDSVRNSEHYLRGIACTFPSGTKCTVEKGKAEQMIIETAAADKGTLVTMATHGRSGMNRWLLGSVTEKVLRGGTNPMLLVRATEEGKTDGGVTLKSIVVPLDGSELAEGVLSTVAELAKTLNLAVVLFRAYNIPYSAYAGGEGYYALNYEELLKAMREEAVDYLEKKTEAVGIVLAVALAIFAACATASLVALALPWVLNRLGIDPAFGSGPLATVVQDLLSIVIYLLIATAILG